MPASPSNLQNPDTDELKSLVVDAVVAAKALLTYLDAHPGKLTELKTEFKNRFGVAGIAKLIKLVF
jgi:hypothetical protein